MIRRPPRTSERSPTRWLPVTEDGPVPEGAVPGGAAPGDAAAGGVRVRFAPSPSGDLHVGNIRTAIYDWAFARSTGGRFVLRIEDTDRARVTPEYISSAQDTLRWLGLEWDEGPGAGGAFGPYLQSERLDIYTEWVDRFLKEGHAYHCYCSQEELAERREAARKAGRAVTTGTAAISPPPRSPPTRRRAAGRWSGSGCRPDRPPSPTWSAARSPSTTRT